MNTVKPSPSSAAVSARMSRQARKDTAAELAVRRLLHAAGLRYRVEYPVPGMARRRVDVAFTSVKVAVLIDGCFWHGCPVHATQPKSNAEWWRQKLDRNMARDLETTEHLRAAGWEVLRFWEHETPEDVALRVMTAVDRRRAAARQERGRTAR
jgi:DNA mismatch endonuclease, patch repair protein